MWYKICSVKALDAECCCICVAVLLGRYLCCVAAGAADTQLISCISRALYPLNTRNTPLVSGELDHVMEDIFMTCLPPTFPFHLPPCSSSLCCLLTPAHSSLMVDTGHYPQIMSQVRIPHFNLIVKYQLMLHILAFVLSEDGVSAEIR